MHNKNLMHLILTPLELHRYELEVQHDDNEKHAFSEEDKLIVRAEIDGHLDRVNTAIDLVKELFSKLDQGVDVSNF